MEKCMDGRQALVAKSRPKPCKHEEVHALVQDHREVSARALPARKVYVTARSPREVSVKALSARKGTCERVKGHREDPAEALSRHGK
jgi:hypothetical protein